MRVCLVGCGSIAAFHRDALLGLDGVAIDSVVGRRRSWTDNLLWHHGGHAIDQALWLFGQEPSIVHSLYGPRDNPLGIPLDLSAQMRFPGGGLATFALSYNAMVPKVISTTTFICQEDTLVMVNGELRNQHGEVVSSEDELAAVPRQAAAERSRSELLHSKRPVRAGLRSPS